MKEIHPIAECYPPLTTAEIKALEEHIRLHGLQNDIILFEDKVLDGKHRQLACEKAGIEPRYASPDIADPYAYVVGANERRRHLTTSQRAVVAERIATLKNGRPELTARIRAVNSLSKRSPSKLEAAKLLGVGVTSLDEARYTKEKGIPELHKALEEGKLLTYRAKNIAKLPKNQQPEALQAALNGDKEVGKRQRQRGQKQSSPKALTPRERQDRLHKMLHPVPGQNVGLTREQVDPDFKGSSMDWIDTYGHVSIMTKTELEDDRKNAAVLEWVSAINDLRKPLEKYLQTKPFDLESFEKWLSKSETRRRKLAETVSLITRANESIELLLPVLGK